MDVKVLEAQQWVNATYRGRNGYNEVEEDGRTGWSTMYSLTRALQIELGISVPSDNFGNGTIAALNAYGNISKDANNANQNIVKIIQSALFCKGYNPTAITGTFAENTDLAVKTMQANMGFQNVDGIITPKIFKGLLTMDAYVLLKDSGTKIRQIQQWLNNRYINRQDFFIQPCDGIYSRNTQKALLLAIQYEEGLADGVANGNFGPSTKAKLPTLKTGDSDTTKQFVHLLQAALCFNGFDVKFDGNFDDETKNVVKEFQSFCMLQESGTVDFSTWASLLISYGDENRKGTACDTSTPLTDSHIQLLKKNGFEIVGRYLAHNEKGIKEDEVKRILNNGLKLFLIYQANARNVNDFTVKAARRHAYNAAILAQQRKIPNDTVIYFAVDYDATDYEITNYIIPYLREVKSIIVNAGFKFGVYGSRNVCTRAKEELYSTSSFVSDMSSGFSGNMGFRLPENWNYDQIKNTTISDSQYGTLEIDVDIYRGQTKPVNHLLEYDGKEKVYTQLKALFDCAYYEYGNQDVFTANKLVLDFIRHIKYSKEPFNLVAGNIEDSQEYIDYIKTYFQSIIPGKMTLLDFYDGSINGGVSVCLDHWALTIKSYYTITGLVAEATEYSGWGGDLAQLGGRIQKAYEDENSSMHNHLYTQEEINQLIGCKSNTIAQSLGFANREDTNFSVEDLYQDLDAVYFATQLRTIPISYAFYDYYIESNKYLGRATLFYENTNKSGYEGKTPYQTLYGLALIYTKKLIPVVSDMFEGVFGKFDEELWGEKLAKAFAKRIDDMIKSES